MEKQIKNTMLSAYLREVKLLVREGRFRVEKNPRRRENLMLLRRYFVDRETAGSILLSLREKDFVKRVQNEHAGYENEILYVFGPIANLYRHGEDRMEEVMLYLKLNLIRDKVVIAVSFHEARFPLKKKGEKETDA